MTLRTRVDHLVVAAATLEEGVAWCRETIGIEPAAGGAHPLMGTHNRVFRIDSPAFERAYLEIIAIDPAAPAPGRTRWFDLDQPRMRETLSQGPCLIHFVASTNDVQAATAAMAGPRSMPCAAIAAERGALRWRTTVRPDGQRLFDGALPTLIQWDGAHPCDTLPANGVTLQSLGVTHPQADRLQATFDAIGLSQVVAHPGKPVLAATLETPRGRVRLVSRG